MSLDFLDCTIIDEGSDQGIRRQTVADFHPGGDFRKALRESIVDAALHEDTVRAHARLSRVSIFRSDRALYCGF
jgi:hypothetical protein